MNVHCLGRVLYYNIIIACHQPPRTHNLFDIVAAAAAAFAGSAAVNRVWPRFSSVVAYSQYKSMDYAANVLRFAQGFDSVAVVVSLPQ